MRVSVFLENGISVQLNPVAVTKERTCIEPYN